ncbi:MAG: hydroxymethylbilane synthase [Gracilibacteraceae bacterium]|nr:hydroxymethylbilane synthase [Gracilibacteraceae bacterium]
MDPRVLVGTRESPLALRQTEWVLDRLRKAWPGIDFAVRAIKTKGDRLLSLPLPEIGGKGLFTQELENSLLGHEIDFAVHSMKDVPEELAPGLALRAVGPREDPRDALVSSFGRPLAELPPGAVIGTSSLRRAAQLRHWRSDLCVTPLRGNLATRLHKLDTENLDGIILAAAGLLRLGLAERATEYLPLSVCLPAAGQGALGVEYREDDAETGALLEAAGHRPTELAVTAERTLLSRLGGGCRRPIAALAVWEGETLRLRALAATEDGRRLTRAEEAAAAPGTAEAAALGERVAASIIERGGVELLLLPGSGKEPV